MNIGSIRRQVGQRYFREALSASQLPSNRSREEWLKIVKSVQGKKPKSAAAEKQLVDTLHALVMFFRSGRADRVRRRTPASRWGIRPSKCGTRDEFFKPPKLGTAAAMRRSTLRDLKEPHGRTRVEEFCRGIIRRWLVKNAHAYSGLTTYDVRIGDGEPRVLLHKSRGDHYSGSAKRFRKINARHRVDIRPDWFSTVYRAGLFSAGGMLTLSATPVVGEDLVAFAASWVVCKGYGLSVEKGYIVCADGEHYHGATLRAAKGVLKRARAEKVKESEKQSLRALVENYQDHPEIWDLPVTVAQALAAGNCETGVVSWVSRHFPPGQETASLIDVLKAGVGDQERRVKAVALYVLHKALRKPKEKPRGKGQEQAAQG